MKQFWMVLSVMATLIFVSAQVQVGIQIERDQFLLYEPIPVQLTVLNNTGSLLKISGDWLSFLVTEQNGSGIRRDNKLKVDPLELESGSRKKITINITPLYSIRDIGAYHIQGIIEIDGVQYVTPISIVNVANGVSVWSESRPIQGIQRIYSILRFSPSATNTQAFVRVEEPSENKVYATYSLGDMVSFMTPETKFDKEGNLHILHPKGQGFYCYSRVSISGKLENQADYRSSPQGRPSLQTGTEGIVIVQGGQTLEGKAKRNRLSQGQNLLTTKNQVPVSTEKESPK